MKFIRKLFHIETCDEMRTRLRNELAALYGDNAMTTHFYQAAERHG